MNVKFLQVIILFGLILPSYAIDGTASKTTLILPKKGRVGVFALRSPIKQYRALVRKGEQANSYHTPDGQYRFSVDDKGEIREITVTVRGLFTDRFVRIKHSTLRDVFAKYGTPQATRHQKKTLYVKYPRIEFFFEGVERGLITKAGRAELLQKRVTGVILR